MKLSVTDLALICKQFGYTFASLGDVNSGYRNTSYQVFLQDGQMVNVLAHKADPLTLTHIRVHHALGATLAATGLPVREPFDPRILIMRRGTQRSLIALYTYLPGRTIPWEAYGRSHIKLLGYALASFHRAARNIRDLSLPDVEEDYRAIVKKMQRYFGEQSVRRAMHEKCGIRMKSEALDTYLPFLAECKRLPGRQPLHMDFVRGNVLFDEQASVSSLSIGTVHLSGIIDLEKVALGHPLFDVARTLAFLIVDCPKPAAKLYRYFIDSGYIKRGGVPVHPRQVVGLDMLETLINMLLTYDLYKFLRDNPYESLVDNYHFMRTRDILLARGLVY